MTNSKALFTTTDINLKLKQKKDIQNIHNLLDNLLSQIDIMYEKLYTLSLYVDSIQYLNQNLDTIKKLVDKFDIIDKGLIEME